MSQISTHPPKQAPNPASNPRAIVALILGILAFISFFPLALPTDLILLNFAWMISAVSPFLEPFAYGSACFFTPLGMIAAIVAIVMARSARNSAEGQVTSNMTTRRLATAGMILGWSAVALYLLSLGVVILSLMGVVNPLI